MITRMLTLLLCCTILSGCSSTQHQSDSATCSKPTASKNAKPTMPKAPLWQQFQVGDNITIIIPSDNLFEAGTDHFIDKSEKVLSDVARILKKYPDKNILVTANTAGIGTPAFEKKLSEQQVMRVITYFSNHGIEDNDRRLLYAALSDTQPIVDPSLAKGIAANRRIQITLYNDPTPDISDKNDPINNE